MTPKTSTPAAQGTVAEPMVSTVEPDFLKTLMGAASMAESEAKDETDEGKAWSLNFLAGKLRDAAFVIDQMTKLRDGQIALGYKLAPVEPTDEMLAATCDENGRMRLLEFTTPEERSKAFLMPRYAYRAMLSASPPPPTEALPASGVEAVREALVLTAGALQAGRRSMAPAIAFTGEWAHLGTWRVSDILDKADAALSPTEAPAPAPGGVVGNLREVVSALASRIKHQRKSLREMHRNAADSKQLIARLMIENDNLRRAALATDASPSGWQDISTAPKDGTRFQVRYEDGATEDGVYWTSERYCILGAPQGSKGPGCMSSDIGLPVEPTQWRPTPPAKEHRHDD
jgi:hypothetical protein